MRVAVAVSVAAAVSWDTELFRALGLGLRRWGFGSAKVEFNVGGRLAGEGVPVVVVGIVCTRASSLASRAASGWAASAGLKIHAIGLEGAVGTGAVDVGDVIPDGAVESVLELSDGA